MLTNEKLSPLLWHVAILAKNERQVGSSVLLWKKKQVLTTCHVFVKDKLPYEKGETANLWSDGRNAEPIKQQGADIWRWKKDSEM